MCERKWTQKEIENAIKARKKTEKEFL